MSDAITTLVSSVPEFASLDDAGRVGVFDYLESTLAAHTFRLRLTPYAEHSTKDPLGVLTSYSHAVSSWLQQFPEIHRLGLLTGVLNLTYISEPEERAFFEVVLAKLLDEIADNELDPRLYYPEIDSVLAATFRPYSVSSFPSFDLLTRRMRSPGLRDRSSMPFRHDIDSVLSGIADSLAFLVRPTEEQGELYQQYHQDMILTFLRASVDANILLVEDCSFSGTRISNKTGLFLQLINHLFPESLEATLASAGYRPPYVYLLVAYGAQAAVDSVKEHSLGSKGAYRFFTPLFGHVFGPELSIANGLPPAVKQLGDLVGSEILSEKIFTAAEYFHDTYGRRYFEETGVSTGAGIHKSDITFGFKNGGWSIVPYGNTPNNSLTYLWYPHTSAAKKDIVALFPRVESHLDHTNLAVRPADFVKSFETSPRKPEFDKWLQSAYEALIQKGSL